MALRVQHGHYVDLILNQTHLVIFLPANKQKQCSIGREYQSILRSARLLNIVDKSAVSPTNCFTET